MDRTVDGARTVDPPRGARARAHRQLRTGPPAAHRDRSARAPYALYNGAFNQALATEKRLSGTRRNELTAVTETLHQIAASGQLTASRLPVLFTTLSRNVQWWTHGPLLAADQRVEFSGSQLVWQYYPGQGIQLQVLGTFGRANGLYSSGAGGYPALQQLLAEMIPLAAQRAGSLTWEYYFNFDGGSPPWTSAMSQATGLQALSHAYLATKDPSYLSVAGQALPLFTRRATVRGRRRGALGHALSAVHVCAGHVDHQRLPADADRAGHLRPGQRRSPRAAAVRRRQRRGDGRGARFDTGAWSLYQPGLEDTLSYHELVTGFLGQLCTLTGAPVYCTTAQHFAADETTPPVLTQLTGRGRAKHATQLRFRLSKVSHVGITITQGTRTRAAHQRELRLRRAQLHRAVDHPGRHLFGAAHGRRPGRQREPDHRHPADQPLTRAGAGSESIDSPDASAHDPVHGQGRGGQDLGGGGDGPALRRGRPAHPDRLHRPGPQPGRVAAGRGEGEPTEVTERLWAQQVGAQAEMERHWSGVQEWLGELFMERGVDRISAEELTVPPGMDELFSLLRLQAHNESGDWDAIVVDCAPTGETLRLLSFPDVAQWWIDKVFPYEKQILAAARPIARTLLDISLPTAAAFADIQRLSQNLIAMNEILRDRRRCTIRLVMNPDRMVIGEAMRTFTYLNLYGYLTDAVVVNRLFSAGVGEYFAAWRAVQEEQLGLVHSAFSPVPVLCAPVLRAGGGRAPRCSTASPPSCSPTATRPQCCTTPSPSSSRSTRTARGCGSPCRSPRRGRSRSRRSGSS